MKKEVFDFYQIEQHPVNLAFAVFSAVKRAVCLTRNHTSLTLPIAPATPLVRRLTGFTGIAASEVVKFMMATAPCVRGCVESWDSVLGQRWDVLRGSSTIEETLDTVVKNLRFQEIQAFGSFTIRCTVTALQGQYHHEKDYRALIRHNMTVASQIDSSVA